MKIPYPNASSRNKIGLQSQHFSFSASIREKGKVVSLWICPIATSEIADLLTNYSLHDFVLFDIDHTWIDEKFNLFTLVEIANKENVKFTSFGEQIISVTKEEFVCLMKDFNHYNFHTFDYPHLISEDELIEMYFICNDHKWNEENFMLNSLKNSSLYVDCHDNCYLYIESVNLGLIVTIFQRALQIYLGTILFENIGFKNDICDLSQEIIEQIWPVTSPITIFPKDITINSNKICMPYSNVSFSLSEKEYTIVGAIEYDYVLDGWCSI